MKNDALKETKQPAKSLYEKRRRFGQCFKCEEQYKQGHQCYNKGLHLIKGMDEDDEEFKEAKEGDTNGIEVEFETIEEYKWSIS